MAVILAFVLLSAPQHSQGIAQPVQATARAEAVPEPKPSASPAAVVAAATPKPTPQPVVKPDTTVVVSSGDTIEYIVRQAARKYGIDENYFLRVARCESSLNHNSVNYKYFETGPDGTKYYPTGLFQHVSRYWPSRAAEYGYSGASIKDSVAQANVTAQMFRDGLGYLWECK